MPAQRWPKVVFFRAKVPGFVGCALFALTSGGRVALFALPYLALCIIGRNAAGEAGRRLYRLFLIANVTIGALITLLVLLTLPVDGALPAGMLALAGTTLALSASVGRAFVQRR